MLIKQIETDDLLRQLIERLQGQSHHEQDIISGIDAIAAELDISYQHCRNCLIAGQIPARRLGERWLASRSALRRWVAGEDIASATGQEASKRRPGRPRKKPAGGAV